MDHHKPVDSTPTPRVKSRRLQVFLSLVLILTALQCARVATGFFAISGGVVNVPLHAPEVLEKCQLLQVPPGPPPDFYTRRTSDRFVSGTTPTLITVSAQSRRVSAVRTYL